MLIIMGYLRHLMIVESGAQKFNSLVNAYGSQGQQQGSQHPPTSFLWFIFLFLLLLHLLFYCLFLQLLRAKNFRAEFFALLLIYLAHFVVLEQNLFIGLMNLFVCFVQRERILNVSHGLFNLPHLIKGQSPFIDGFHVIWVDDYGLVVDELRLFPQVLIKKARANVKQQIGTQLSHLYSLSFRRTVKSIGLQISKSLLIKILGCLVSLCFEFNIALTLQVQRILDTSFEDGREAIHLRRWRDW